MKKISLLFLSAACVAALQSCSGSKTGSGSDSSGTVADSNQTSVSQADSSNAGQGTAMADTTFARKAATGGLAEVALGKLASTKGASQQVKDFGNMMIMDHSKANAELMTIAQKKNLTLPAGLDAEHQAKSDSLRKLSGAAFDKAYVQAMVKGHEQTLALMQSEASGGQDADLKMFAVKTAPVVQHHLEEIKKIQSSMK